MRKLFSRALAERGWAALAWGLLALATLLPAACTRQAPPLPALGADIEAISVSGLSSGAYMAGQFQLAHGRRVAGAGIIAGGPWGCADSLAARILPGPGAVFVNLGKAINGCMLNGLKAWGVPNPVKLARKAARLAAEGRIDPLSALREDRVYLFTGGRDRTVVPAIVKAAAAFYREVGVPEAQIRLVTNPRAGHGFITRDAGAECSASAAPYINDCDYDQAGALLRHIHGPLAPPSASPKGRLLVFDQTEFTRDFRNHGMGHVGLAYVPDACEPRGDGVAGGGACRVHVVFHGCGQNRDLVGDRFARQSGFSRWADTNRMIVLFPQTGIGPANAQGCWDWWGLTGPGYLTRDAPQIKAVRRMLARLAQGRGP